MVKMRHQLSATLILLLNSIVLIGANLDYFRSQDFDIPPPSANFWSNGLMDPNSSLTLGSPLGCSYCGEIFYHEPPPDDIIFIPPPPLHPSFQGSGFAELIGSGKQQGGDQCAYCNLFYSDGEQLANLDGVNKTTKGQVVVLLGGFSAIGAVLCLYLIGTRRSRIIATLHRTNFFKSNQAPHHHHGGHPMDKNNSLEESIANSGVHLSDPCYLQTNRDKNLTSPIISDHAHHKKTAIPSKCWAQPGSIIGRTIRRIPNEYEVPSSQTNSTGTSAGIYADVNQDHNDHRFFSPYNFTHTYAEVREVLDPEEHFHTSSNSSAMHSESNYDNAVHNHNNCGIQSNGVMTSIPTGSVQMSDFNSMRPMQSMAYGQHQQINHHTLNHAAKMHHNNGQPVYEQPPQRAQIIITSNNQGVNPQLINYRDRIHNVI